MRWLSALRSEGMEWAGDENTVGVVVRRKGGGCVELGVVGVVAV